VFLELPRHVEYRVDNMPLLPEGTVVEFSLNVKNPRDPTKSRDINGPYKVIRRKLKYLSDSSSKRGLSQYLEWEPVNS
jgi:hypothetical protein